MEPTEIIDVTPEAVEIPLELPAPAAATVATLPAESVVEIWKAITALTHDAQATCNHATRIETGRHAIPALVNALEQLGYGVHDGILIPPGCTWDAKAGQVIHPE